MGTDQTPVVERDANVRSKRNPELGDSRLPARFWSKVQERGGCWLWIGAIGQNGYGRYLADSRRIIGGVRVRSRGSRDAHRTAYRALVSEIAEGLTLDHLCRTRACVNPAHLEPVTQRVNVLRGESAPAVNAAKTRCIRGHELSGSNLRIVRRRDGRTARECITCRRARRYRRAS